VDTVTTPLRLLKLPQVLDRVPVSKSTWWSGVASGRFPKPVSLGPRSKAWLEEDVNSLILTLIAQSSQDQISKPKSRKAHLEHAARQNL
jgi:prophage regulatory protein